MDQRLTAKFMELHNAELVVIGKKITVPAITKNLSDKEIIVKYKEKHLEQVRDIIQNVDGIILPGNKDDINPVLSHLYPENNYKGIMI